RPWVWTDRGGFGMGTGAFWAVRVTVTGTSAAATKPAAVAAFSGAVTVKVCGSVMPLVAIGAMLIVASSKVLVAGPLSPVWLSPVPRVAVTPLTVKLVLALPRTRPAVAEVKVTANWPLPLVLPVKGPA